MNERWIGTVEEVRRADSIAIKKYGVPSLALMDGAAEAVLKLLMEFSLRRKTICILAGKGNNAGDGFALACKLMPLAKRVTVVTLLGDRFTGDAAYYHKKCVDSGVEILTEIGGKYDIYVDAVFGTGFKGDLPDSVIAAFEKAAAEPAIKISIDLPSGVYGGGSHIAAGAFRADHTVTFQMLKPCHIFPGPAAFCGMIHIEEIGLPAEAIREAGITSCVLQRPELPKKDDTSHKTNNGRLLSVVGSRPYQGAATLSLLSSLSSGCGLVTGVIPDTIYNAVAAKVTGAILLDLPSAASGGIDAHAFRDGFDDLLDRHPTAILAGSGAGVSVDTGRIIGMILKTNLPVVIDGDGLRYVKNKVPRSSDTILTPHIGEFSAMTGIDVSEIRADRFTVSRNYARENRCVVVLKDYITVIALPDGRAFAHCAPNAGLAKGGSGDVLAGMIASFLAQGNDAETAAKLGVYYHSLAGRRAAERAGVYAMRPEDVIAAFREVLI